MKQYLDLLNRVLTEGTEKVTVPEPEPSAFSVIKCVLILMTVSRA